MWLAGEDKRPLHEALVSAFEACSCCAPSDGPAAASIPIAGRLPTARRTRLHAASYCCWVGGLNVVDTCPPQQSLIE
jgi:hypothetical protein